MVSNDLHSAKFKGIFSPLISLNLSDVWGTAFHTCAFEDFWLWFPRHVYCLFFSSSPLRSPHLFHTFMSFLFLYAFPVTFLLTNLWCITIWWLPAFLFSMDSFVFTKLYKQITYRSLSGTDSSHSVQTWIHKGNINTQIFYFIIVLCTHTFHYFSSDRHLY